MEQVAFGVMANQDPPTQNDPRRTKYERSQYSRRLTPDRSTTEMWSGVSRFLASWALHSHAQKVPDILGCPELQSVEKVQPIWAFRIYMVKVEPLYCEDNTACTTKKRIVSFVESEFLSRLGIPVADLKNKQLSSSLYHLHPHRRSL